MTMDIAFSPEESTFKGAIKASGKGAPTLKAQKDTTTSIRLLKGLSIHTPDLLSYEANSTDINMTFTVEKEQLAENKGGYYIYELPLLDGDFVNSYPHELATNRTEDIDLGYKIDLRYIYNVTTPQGYSVVIPGEKMIIKTDFGSLTLSYSKTTTGVTVTRTFSISEPLIKQQNYKELKNMMDSWRIAAYRQLIIKDNK